MRLLTFLCLPILALASCTGLGINTHTGQNLNPAPEYGNLAVVTARAGVFYHQNGVPGPKGNAASVKTGKGCNYSILWLVAFGDSSIDTIREDAGIRKVASVDYDETAILGFFFHKFCTTVSGE